MSEPMRLQKYLSQAGVASRREAERLIEAGKGLVNEGTATIGQSVDPATDTITINGKTITAPSTKIYLAFHKPMGVTTTRDDEHAVETITDYLPPELHTVVWPVGRLDKESSGLLILTNDGDLTQELTHPSFHHEKEYVVVIDKPLTAPHQKSLERGIMLNGTRTAPAKFVIQTPRTILVTLHEGRKRQIRRMFRALGYEVIKLKRIRIGNLELGELPVGRYQEITRGDII